MTVVLRREGGEDNKKNSLRLNGVEVLTMAGGWVLELALRGCACRAKLVRIITPLYTCGFRAGSRRNYA